MRAFRSPTDKRVVKTERAIKAALTSLMSERDVADISVKDVAERALISKKTFYAHYSSVYAVLEEMEEDAATSFSQLIGGLDVLGDRVALAEVLKRISTTVGDKRSEIGCLLHSRVANDLFDKVKQTISQKMSEADATPAADGRMRPSYVTESVAGGMVSVLKQWAQSDSDLDASIDEVSDVVSSIATKGIGARG